jgi:hypothetical protein
MTKPAFTPPSRGGSYRIRKDGKAERVSFTVQRDDPAHPDHPSLRSAPPPAEKPAAKKES